MDREPDHFHEQALRAQLSVAGFSGELRVHETLDSTSSEALRVLHSEVEDPVVVLAARQHAGRGRRGNQWASDCPENLYLSIGFRPGTATARIGLYTLWVGMRLAACLGGLLGVDLKVKWPNDLYWGERKVGGILTEAKIDSEHVQHLVVGLGLNVNGELASFPEELREKAASLRMACARPLPYAALVAQVVMALVESSLLYFSEDSASEGLMQSWGDYDFLRGRLVSARGASGQVEGYAEGIDAKGHLLLRLQDGSLAGIHSGEVTLVFERRA
jgi:BirA family biotin operon repressor/biotin-[acetyl-CoA-carboxylase] ligase